MMRFKKGENNMDINTICGTDGQSIPDVDERSNVLEMIDPNDNCRCRYQYQYYDGILLRRQLPAAEDGDRWRGDYVDEPWWEVMHIMPPGGPIYNYWRMFGGDPIKWMLTREKYREVLALAPDGRPVRYTDRGLLIQPAESNDYVEVNNMTQARLVYYGCEPLYLLSLDIGYSLLRAQTPVIVRMNVRYACAYEDAQGRPHYCREMGSVVADILSAAGYIVHRV